MPSKKSFGEAIFDARTKRDWTLARLSQCCGLSRSYLSALENEKVPPPTSGAIIKIAKGLELNPDEWELLEAAASASRLRFLLVKHLPSRLQPLADVLSVHGADISERQAAQVVSVLRESAM